MKLYHICMKNFKVLFRSKTSAITILLGPLVILLLVGLAFNSQSHIQLNVGVYASNYTELANSFVDAIKENQINVEKIASKEDCIQKIKLSQLHVCMVFPDNFVIANNKTNVIMFYVDQSRTNFVYTITDIIGKKVEFKRTELSVTMTDVIINTLTETKQKNEQNILLLIKADTEEEKAKADVVAIKSKVDQIDLTQENVATDNIADKFNALSTEKNTLIQKGKNVLSDGYGLLDSIDSCQGCSNLSTAEFASSMASLNTSITNLQNTTGSTFEELNRTLADVTQAVDKLNTRLANAKVADDVVKQKADDLRIVLDQLKNDTGKVKSSLEGINDKIDSIRVTSAESIVSPITTQIEPITTEGTNLNYLLPYLIILIIMFISIMLSATMVVMEKKSRAFFRNFVTPTEDITFIFGTFLTNILLTLVQLVIIMTAAYFLLHIVLPANIWPAVLLIVITICLFTAIGMGIGYLLSSQEGVTLASLSIGSILLLLSNIIIPLESMSPLVQSLAKYNIYVIASEILRKIMLFQVTPSDLYISLASLFAVALAIFILIVFIQKLTKAHYLLRLHSAGKLAKVELRLYNGHIVSSLRELQQELEVMDDKTFAKHKHEFYKWIRSGLHNKQMATAVKDIVSRTDMIKALDKEAPHK